MLPAWAHSVGPTISTFLNNGTLDFDSGTWLSEPILTNGV